MHSAQETPPVTIVVTAYNSKKFIVKTIESLAAQTYPALEILISDDGSTDGTRDVLLEMAARFGNIRLNFNEKNLGIAKNYNRAVGMASGEFVIGISHDDLLPPAHVEKMLRHFDAPDVGVVHCNAIRIDSEGNEHGFVAKNKEKIVKTVNPMKWLCFNNFIQSCGLMFRRQAFLEIGGWDESFSYDSEWYTYIRYAEAYIFKYATDTYAYYRVHDTNISKYLKKERRDEFEAYRQRCREMAMARADINVIDRARIRLKIWRKRIKRMVLEKK